MKRIITGLVLAGLVAAITVVPASAATSGKTASVTVNTYISVTLTDNNTSGLVWGNLDPGVVQQDEEAVAAANPSIVIAAGAENNADTDINVYGTDFSDGGTNSFAITNAYWHTSDVPASSTTMKLQASKDTVTTLSASGSVDIYHYLSIPNGQTAATYTSTFTYESVGGTFS